MAETYAPGSPYVSRLSAGVASSGLAGTVRFRLLDSDATVDDPVYGPSTASIVEDPTGSGDYLFNGTTPTVEGKYFPAWDLGSGQLYYDEDLIVSYSAAAVGTPAGEDLCTLADVLRYVPAYISESDTDATLQALITAESQLFQQDAKREIARRSVSESARLFTVTTMDARRRIVEIGDLSDTPSGVTLLENDGTTDLALTTEYVLLFEGDRTARATWKPITEISFPRHLADPRVDVCQGKVLQVTGVWGFPSIPSFVREGVSARVILRYLLDVAAEGTPFADAVIQSNLNFGGFNDRAQDALAAVQYRAWP